MRRGLGFAWSRFLLYTQQSLPGVRARRLRLIGSRMQDGGHKIRKALASAGTGFCDQVFAIAERFSHCFG